MSRPPHRYSICSMPEYPIRVEYGIPQLPLRRIFLAHPASTSPFIMGYSGRARSKRRRYVPTEIWLQIIKCSMPSMISVSKPGRNGQNVLHSGFHLWLFFSKLPDIMNLAHVSKTWYMEVKEALYAQPLWNFDTIQCALSNFLSYDPVRSLANITQVAEYDAAISRIQHVHIGALRMPCFAGEQHPTPAVFGQVTSAPSTPDYQQLHRLSLLQNLRHVYIDVGSSGFQEMGQAFKPNAAEGLEAALSAASDLIARFGKRFAKALSFHELAITNHPARNNSRNIQTNREMIHNIKQDGFGMSTPKRDEFREVVSRHVSAVLSKSSDLASSRSKEAELLAMRHRYLVKLRASDKFPKAHAKIKVKLFDRARWGYMASTPGLAALGLAAPEPAAPEPATPEPVTPEPATPEPATPELFGIRRGPRSRRRAKINAINKNQELSRKRPRVI